MSNDTVSFVIRGIKRYTRVKLNTDFKSDGKRDVISRNKLVEIDKINILCSSDFSC